MLIFLIKFRALGIASFYNKKTRSKYIDRAPKNNRPKALGIYEAFLNSLS